MAASTEQSESDRVLVRAVIEIALAALVSVAVAAGLSASGVWDLLPAGRGDALFEALATAFLTFTIASLFSLQTVREWIVTLLFCGVIVVGGAAVGLVVRELLLTGWLPSAPTAAGITVLLLLIAGYWLWRQLRGRGLGVRKTVVDASGAFVAAFVIAISLISLFVIEWNQIVAQLLPFARLNEGDTAGGIVGQLKELADRLVAVFDFLPVVLATAATFYVVVYASPQLKAILEYIQLTPKQVRAGHRLRRPLSDLIHEVKADDLKFKRELVITAGSFEREVPLESVVHGGARVKLVVPPPGHPRDTFTFLKIRGFLAHAQVDLRESLVFVFPSTGLAGAPICYGTGAEMWELMYRPPRHDDPPLPEDVVFPEELPGSGRFRGKYSERFFEALSSGEALKIRAVVADARADVLKHNPQDDVLLTTFALPDSEELIEALSQMKARNLRRALVYANKTPSERAILSIPHIAAYLWDEETG